MAAGFAFSKANIEGPNGETYARATIQVRGATLTIKEKGKSDPTVFDTTVSSAAKKDRNTWLVTTAAGVYVAVKDKDCGCGGSR